MGIQDRDYMREKRLRWDERSGEMRLDETPAPGQTSRWRTWAMVGLMVAVVVAGLAWWRGQSSDEHGSAPEGPVLEGRVSRVIDGDSIEVELSSGPIEVRMHSIDAPEWDQPGGREARAALQERLRGADVVIVPVEQDRYGRMAAVVYLDDANVDAWLVRQGHAWVYRQYARDSRYCEAEIAARSERRGVWARPATEQRAPWEWRAARENRRVRYSDYSGETLERCVAALGRRAESFAPLPLAAVPADQTPKAAPGKCRIKGNISGNGRIYHVPGSDAYESTKIDESKGERWFCTEEEARAAGWRPARRDRSS